MCTCLDNILYSTSTTVTPFGVGVISVFILPMCANCNSLALMGHSRDVTVTFLFVERRHPVLLFSRVLLHQRPLARPAFSLGLTGSDRCHIPFQLPAKLSDSPTPEPSLLPRAWSAPRSCPDPVPAHVRQGTCHIRQDLPSTVWHPQSQFDILGQEGRM